MFKGILAFGILILTLSYAQPLTQVQLQTITSLDISIKSGLKLAKTANEYITGGFYVMTTCSIYGGGYTQSLSDSDFYELLKTWDSGKVFSESQGLNKRWDNFIKESALIIWASYRGIITDNKSVSNDFKNCIATKYSAKKLGVSKSKIKRLQKGIDEIMVGFDKMFINASKNQKNQLALRAQLCYQLRNK